MDHSINDLFAYSTNHMKDMASVDMIVGKPIFLENGFMVTPVSKVKYSFATGGLEAEIAKEDVTPYGGLTGSLVSIDPVCFLVFDGIDVKVLHVNSETHLYERIIDKISDVAKSIKELIENKKA